MRPALLLTVVAASLAFASPALAETVLAQDAQGRTITYDVEAAGVDTAWYTEILGAALHGDEISSVTIRIVPAEEVTGECGSAEAEACYSQTRGGAIIVLPAGENDQLKAVVLHEYGHHVDASTAVGGVREPNGTTRWWAARGMAELAASGEVARDYRLGWERSIAEIFAEDYVQVNTTGARYGIRWLAPPTAEIVSAIRQDLGFEPASAELPTADPAQRVPLVVTRSGRLRPGQARELEFGLLGPGRRVTVTAAVNRGRLRIQISCGGTPVATTTLGPKRKRATLDRFGLGPGDCTATATNVGRVAQSYNLRLRLAVEST